MKDDMQSQAIGVIQPGLVSGRCERIVYVAPDCTDSAVKKRVRGFMCLGHEVTSFSFRRDRYNVGAPVDWPNVEMGRSGEKRLLARIGAVIRAVQIIARKSETWKNATIVYARNLDLAFLALVGKALTGARAPLVFEVLDIHPLLAQRSVRGAMLRWVERRVLNRCRVLVVSSPAYLSEYFRSWQGFAGSAFLLENKWADERTFPKVRKLSFPNPGDSAQNARWTIGWFGNLRCPRSLEILCQLADQLPDRVTIYMRGFPSLLGNDVLSQAIQSRPNMVFGGEYLAPDQLPEIYSRVHFNWCADLSDGENSRWLLSNRIYEGGYFGVPAIAVAGHETGRVVQERELGVVIEPPYINNLKEFLIGLNPEDYRCMRTRIEQQPVQNFLDCGDLARLLKSLAPAI
jgi:succinoglycan biosynthesis protein ExoL